jgi:hypothetical protein
MLRLVTLVVSSLAAMPLVVWLAVSSDAREASLDAPAAATLAAGVAIAVLFTVGGLIVLARPALAVLLFVLAAALGFIFGYEDGREGLAVYGVLALLLSAASAICARWREVPWLTNGRGG